MCCVMPPFSCAATSMPMIRSNSDVLPWSTWPRNVTIGGRGCKLGRIVFALERLEDLCSRSTDGREFRPRRPTPTASSSAISGSSRRRCCSSCPSSSNLARMVAPARRWPRRNSAPCRAIRRRPCLCAGRRCSCPCPPECARLAHGGWRRLPLPRLPARAGGGRPSCVSVAAARGRPAWSTASSSCHGRGGRPRRPRGLLAAAGHVADRRQASGGGRLRWAARFLGRAFGGGRFCFVLAEVFGKRLRARPAGADGVLRELDVGLLRGGLGRFGGGRLLRGRAAAPA